MRPDLVYHADWSKDERKRWASKATVNDAGRYTAFAPRQVGTIGSLISSIRGEIAKAGCAFVGFDFPIGIPAFYAKRTGVQSFKQLLPQLGEGEWKDFFNVCGDASEVSVYRPFYPDNRYAGRKKEELYHALGASSMEELLRACERGGDKQKEACSLFWTLGGNQVGKAAIVGWRDLLAPALRSNESFSLWPFDGTLDSLLVPGNFVIAETYPAECYGWFFRESVVKSDLSSRKIAAADLLSWARTRGVILHDELNAEIQEGFISGDDAFDACVGLFGMLEVLLNNRATGEPDDSFVRSVEGWILGRASNSIAEHVKQSPTIDKTILGQLDEYGESLNRLLSELPDHPAITDTLDYMLGALHGLTQAYRLGFKDRSTKHVPAYRPHLAKYALKIPKGERVNSLWTAGFYFNSGIQRLASAFDRIPQILGAIMEKRVGGKKRSTSAKERMAQVSASPCTHWKAVYDEVNAFKHSPEGRATGRTVSMNDALLGFGEMVQLLSDQKAILVKRYGS